MSSPYDATDFIDRDYETRRSPAVPGAAPGPAMRAPNREEVDARVVEAQQKLAELKRAQEQLERERASLEEVRRRQAEYQTGREEMVQSLTRALGLLEEAEFSARRDAEQMTRSLGELREALHKVQALSEDHWRPDNFNEELTRALTTIENARMEYNSARLKFPLLAQNPSPMSGGAAPPPAPENPFGARTFGELCRLGFAITWPIALVLGVVAVLLLVLVLKR